MFHNIKEKMILSTFLFHKQNIDFLIRKNALNVKP